MVYAFCQSNTCYPVTYRFITVGFYLLIAFYELFG